MSLKRYRHKYLRHVCSEHERLLGETGQIRRLDLRVDSTELRVEFEAHCVRDNTAKC